MYGGLQWDFSFSSVFVDRQFSTGTPWRWWTSLLASTGIFVATTLVVAVPIVAYVLGSATPEQIEGGDFGPIPSAVTVGAMLASQLAVILLVILLTRKGVAPWRNRLHLASPAFSSRSLLAILVTIAATLMAAVLWSLAFPEADAVDGAWAAEMLAPPETRLVALAVIIAGAPLSEELLFRGFLLPPLTRTRLGFSGAAILSSLLWALIHFYTWQGFAIVFVIGLALSYLLWRTGSLWPGIVLHAILNVVFVAGIVAF